VQRTRATPRREESDYFAVSCTVPMSVVVPAVTLTPVIVV
jgi:hypothetical protein